MSGSAAVDSAAAAVVELELKLALPPQHIERVKRHPALRPISPHRAVVAELDAIYFDTADLRLQAEGIALRLREAGGRWVQTIKTRGEMAGALHRRTEWETPSDGRQPDLSVVDDARLRRFLAAPEIGPQLQPVFRTRFRRWARLLVLADGSRIELALDHGVIEAGGRQDPISELELELKSGRASALYDLALALLPGVQLRPEPRSKAERGLALHTGALPHPVRARVPAAGPGQSPAQACAGFLAAGLEQFERNLAGAVLGEDPEYLHQARVALRRIRAVLGVFRPILPADATAGLGAGLRTLMAEIGPARDWDVFCGETLPRVQAVFPAHTGLAALARVAADARSAAQERSRQALDAEGCVVLVLRLGQLCAQLSEAPPDGAAAASGVGLKAFARQALRKRLRRARPSRAELAGMDIEARHAWRIALKKLRYTGDFLLPVLCKAGAARRWLEALGGLQDILGAMNDAACTRILLDGLPDAAAAPLAEARALVEGFVEGSSHARLEALEAARAQLADHPLPWNR